MPITATSKPLFFHIDCQQLTCILLFTRINAYGLDCSFDTDFVSICLFHVIELFDRLFDFNMVAFIFIRLVRVFFPLCSVFNEAYVNGW